MNPIKHILLSLTIILSLYVTGIYALKKIAYKQKPIIYITNNYYTWKGGDTYEKFQQFDRKKKYDLVFAGSSRAYRGYDPSIFEAQGYQSFNLGTSAQTIKNTYFTVKHFISNANCKLLVVDVFSGAFTNNDLESSSDMIENISDPNAAYDIAWHEKEIRTLNMAGLRYLTEGDAPYFKSEINVDRGYTTRTDSLPKEKQLLCLSKSKVNFPKIRIDDEQLEYFNKLLVFCKQNSIKVVCIYSPVSYFYDREQHKEFLSHIDPILEKNKTPFYDLSQLKDINAAYHFYDDSHLNKVGVTIFNTALIQHLKNDQLITENAVN